MSTRPVAHAALVSLLAFGCDAAPAGPPSAAKAALAPGELARVADQRIDVATVEAIAAAQHTSVAVARERAIRDALFAVEARRRGHVPRGAESAALARELLARERASLDGPATDEEVASATARHWLALDRPEGFRVIHALAFAVDPKKPRVAVDEATWARAEAVATRFRTAMGPAIERAKQTPVDDAAVKLELDRMVAATDAEGLQTKVESLDPVADDGRVVTEAGGRYAVEFATAVARLRERGDMTPPFRSPYGVHVAILLERTPERRVALEERRSLLHDEVVDGRLRKARVALVAPHEATVELPPNAAALLDLVQVSARPPGAPEGRP